MIRASHFKLDNLTFVLQLIKHRSNVGFFPQIKNKLWKTHKETLLIFLEI